MNSLPFILGFILCAVQWPQALAWFISYFLVGLLTGSILYRVAIKSPRESTRKYATAIFWVWFYGWPLAAIAAAIVLV